MDIMWLFPRDVRFRGVLFDYPSIVLGIVLLYLWFVLKAGPAWMSTREPFRLKTVIRIFNLFQILANICFSYQMVTIAIRNYYTGHFSFGCNPPTFGVELENKDDQDMLLFASVSYFYVRMLDFLDTVFFVLAKKQSHVTFLHVYHHVNVTVTSFIYMRSGWAPSIFYASVLNSVIHIVMYTYYFLSTFSVMRRYLWWKKYLTALQIFQFGIALLQVVWVAVFNCGYPVLMLVYNMSQCVLFISLFSSFYIRSYGDKKAD